MALNRTPKKEGETHLHHRLLSKSVASGMTGEVPPETHITVVLPPRRGNNAENGCDIKVSERQVVETTDR